MTYEEAKTIAAICETADGGCWCCVSDLLRHLDEARLGWRFLIDDDGAAVVKSEDDCPRAADVLVPPT